MNLFTLLQAREKPVRVGIIGAGKFGSMFLAQVPTTPGLDVALIADLSPDRARQACRTVGWSDERIAATRFVEDGKALCADDAVEVVIDSTGSPAAGVAHALAAFAHGKHIVMVNVEADVLAGPALAAGRAQPASSTRWRMAISLRSSRKWSTGRVLRASMCRLPARERNTFPPITP